MMLNSVAVADQPCEACQQPPDNHDARDPLARAPCLRQQSAWNFKQAIANKKDARAEAKNGVGKAQFARHVEPREADVHAVEERKHVQREKERQDAPRDLAACLRGESFRGGRHRAFLLLAAASVVFLSWNVRLRDGAPRRRSIGFPDVLPSES